jgi:hypothetical protein
LNWARRVSVFDASRAGSGFPDLVCGYRGRTWLLEVKAWGGSLTPDQERFHGSFRGELYVVRDVDEALATTRTIMGSTT